MPSFGPISSGPVSGQTGTGGITPIPPTPPTVEIFVRSAQLALLPNLTNLKWCMFTQATPDLFDTAPVARGATLATDGGAKLVIPATLAPRVYFLIFTTSDGTTTQMPPPQSFAAPITVA